VQEKKRGFEARSICFLLGNSSKIHSVATEMNFLPVDRNTATASID